MSQGSLNPKIRFLGQKVCPVTRGHTTQTDTKVTTVGTLSWFQEFFLQPAIKDRPNNMYMSIQLFIFTQWIMSIAKKNKSIISENIDFERKWMFAYVLPQPNQNILLTFVLLVSWIKSNFQCLKKAHERSRFLVNPCER